MRIVVSNPRSKPGAPTPASSTREPRNAAVRYPCARRMSGAYGQIFRQRIRKVEHLMKLRIVPVRMVACDTVVSGACA